MRFRNSFAVFALLAVAVGGGPAAAQDGPRPGTATAEGRLDRLEKELTETRDELRKVKAAQEGRPGGAPTAAAQGEKFEKKFGKDSFSTWSNGFSHWFIDPNEPDPEKRVLHRIGLSGRLQTDLRVYQDADHPQQDRFFLRRARLAASGTFYKYHDWIVEYDLGQFGAGITEAWMQFNYVKWLQLRVGQFKEPMSLERHQSSRYLNFIERAMPKRWLAIDFDIGAMALGSFGDMVQYQIAVQNGTSTGVADNNDDKDVNARLVLTPFKPDAGSYLENLIVGGSVGYGHQKNFLPVYRTGGDDGGSTGGTAATSFLQFHSLAAGTFQRGPRTRWGLELRHEITAAITLQAEYSEMYVSDLTPLAGEQSDLKTKGSYVDLLWMVTGEHYQWSKRVIPDHNFNPLEGGWGAWQVGARWEWCQVDREDVRDLAGDGANEVNGLVLGVNWYLNPLTKVQFNYNRNWFNEPAAHTRGDAEDVFMVRVAFEF